MALVLVSGVLLVILVINYGVFSAGAFGNATLSRTSSVDVVADVDAIHGLDRAQTVHVNATDPLVNVTNGFERSVTITVSLDPDSASFGDLVINGEPTGSDAIFTLNSGATQTVSIAIPDDPSIADETLYFRVDASAPGLTVTATNRSVPVGT